MVSQTLKEKSGYGNTPLGMVAARMGRPNMLIGSGLGMSHDERKGLILSSSCMGLYREALSIFSEAPADQRAILNETIWASLGVDFSGLPLPESDPPPLWWDRGIKISRGPEYPNIFLRLVNERPHLSRDLAAAMLRSGIQQVEALTHAQPGLSASDRWPAMDGNNLPAVGVVVDSWIASLGGKAPGRPEKSDLASKCSLVYDSLPREIGQQPSAQNWSIIARAILGGMEAVGVNGTLPDHCQLSRALMEEWERGSYITTPNAWKRWAEIVVYSFWGSFVKDITNEAAPADLLLPFVRRLFLDLHGSDVDRQSQIKAEEAMQHFLGLPDRLSWHEKMPSTASLEWSFWVLLCERSAATNGFKSVKDITSGPARTLRQIKRSMEEDTVLSWDHLSAKSIHGQLCLDQELPGWLLSFLEKEVLRLSNVDTATGSSRARGRL